jgi:hypothetical protein
MSHGISRRELCSMREAEFQKTLQYFRGDGRHIDDSNNLARVTSQYRYVSPKVSQRPAAPEANYDEDDAIRIAIMNSLDDQLPKSTPPQREATSCQSSSYSYVFHEPRSPTGPLSEIQQQDLEYKAVCEAADQKDFDSRNQEWFSANETQIAEEESRGKEAEAIARYYGLPPEPSAGTTIAVVMDGQRKMRKFDPKRPAADVYSWVAGQTINADDGKLFIGEFELAVPGKGVIDPELTLDEQGIGGRVMVQIHEVD